MKSEIKSADGLVREIEIEVDAETVDAAFAEAYKKYSKEAKIKGFRPGKAPMSVIKSKFGDAIRDEVLDELMEKSYPEAVKEQDLRVASAPMIPPNIELKEGSPLKYTAKVEVLPEIEKINIEGLQLPEIEVEVRDPEVDAVVDYLRKKHAEIRPVEREAKEDDIIFADLTKTDDPDNVLEGDSFSDIEIDLASDITVKEFKDSLPGIKPGEEREVSVSYPADYNNKMLAGKSLKYLCKVKEVRERVLPPENDAFAKQVDEEIETVLEMRMKIREDLKRQKEMDHSKWKSNEIQRQFLDKNQIDVPEAMIERYINGMIEDFQKQKKEIDEKTAREQYRPVAVNSIRWTILTAKLAIDENIEVLPEDTEKWIKRFADNYNMDMEKAREVLSKSGRIQEIRDSILDEKILDFLITKVTYIPQEDFKKDNNITEEK